MSLTHSPVARRSTSFHASSMTSIERPANTPASALAQAFGAAALDARGDVLGEHEQHGGGQLARDLAGVEGDQRRVGGDGGLAVEQVGVGAVVDERGDPLGEGAQDGGDLLGAGAGLVLGAAAQLLAEQPLARALSCSRAARA